MTVFHDRLDPAIIDRLLDLPAGRHIVAISGAPASGKSTYAADLVRSLIPHRSAALVPMDGFHLDNRLLEIRGLCGRKGAPETFDIGGLHDLLLRIKAGGTAVHPVFDRAQDIAIAGAAEIDATAELIVVEGNYLLCDLPGWCDLASLWSLTIFLDVSEPVLRDRLLDRWRGRPDAEIKVEDNDMPNARLIAARSIAADIVIREV